MRISLFILGILFSLSFIAQAQNASWEIKDVFPKPEGQINASLQIDNELIIGGTNWDQYKYHPLIYRLNSEGNIIWSTVDFDDFDYEELDHSIIEIILGQDDFLYALKRAFPFEIWKVNPNSGEIIWREVLDIYPFDDNYHLLDYNNDQILLAYLDEESAETMSIVNKSDGSFEATYSLDNLGSNLPFAITADQDGNIYYSQQDTITKLSGSDLTQILWKEAVTGDDDIQFFQKFYFDELYNKLYIYGQDDGGFNEPLIAAIDPGTGFTDWMYFTESNMNASYSCIEVDEAGIYFSSKFTSIIGGNYPCLIHRIDRATQSMDWHLITNFDNNLSQAPIDMLIQGNDLYLSGYHTSYSFGTGLWGIMKIDAALGEKVYSNTIINDNYEGEENSSIGKGIFMIDNELYTAGQLQTEEYKVTNALVHIDKETGEQLNTKYLGGRYELPVSVIDSKKMNGDDRSVFLLNDGINVHLQMREANGEILWDQFFIKDDFGFGHALDISEENKINIAVTTWAGNNISPYYYDGETDNTYILQYDENGNLLSEAFFDEPNFPSGTGVVTPIDILDDGQTLFLVYKNGDNETLLRKIENEIVSESISFNMIISNDDSKNILIDNDSQILLFGNNSIKVIEKEDLTSTSISSTGQVFLDLKKLDDDLVFTSGFSNTGHFTSLFSLDIMDTIWTAKYPPFGSFVNMALDAENEYAYLHGVVNDSSIVRKVAMADGNLEWEVFTGAGEPALCTSNDIAYNDFNDQIILCGSKKESIVNDSLSGVFLDIFDTNGERLFSEIKTTDKLGSNEAMTATVLSNGSFYIGGHYMKTENDYPIGFIDQYESDFITNAVHGKVFWDENNNGLMEQEESTLNLGQVWIDSTATAFVLDGRFISSLPYGNHSFTYLIDPNWMLSSDTLVYEIELTDEPNDTLCFGVIPIFDMASVETSIHSSILRCNQEATIWLHYKNTGTQINNGSLYLEYPNNLIYQSASMMPDNIEANRLYWEFTDLLPANSDDIAIIFDMPGVSAIGELLPFESKVYLNDGNGIVIDSFDYQYSDTLRCAYDPNDKLVNPPGVGDANYTLFEQELFYTIRFQNTGNDTAFVVNLVDTLDSNLDLTSFSYLSSSHDLTSLTLEERVLNFEFDNILLPDSTTNEPQSHGYVSYKISPIQALEEMTSIKNRAGIIFDSNPPIITNTTNNTLVSELPVYIETVETANFLNISPNPVENFFYLELDDAIKLPVKIRIHDAIGGLIENFEATISSKVIKTEKWETGWYQVELIDANGHQYNSIIIKQ